MPGTEQPDYADRLVGLSASRWKRLLDVQRPYRWNLRRQRLGLTLDVGCGIGRNLLSLDPGSVGIDHNPASVEVARSRGCTAYTPEEWRAAGLDRPGQYDGLLLAHVLEHMTSEQAKDLLLTYLPALRPGGKVFLVCPQERGFLSDPTHVEYLDGEALVSLARSVGLVPDRLGSFPFPRWAGRLFTYNEHTLSATYAG